MRIVGVEDIFCWSYPVGVHADVTMSGGHGGHTIQRGTQRQGKVFGVNGATWKMLSSSSPTEFDEA